MSSPCDPCAARCCRDYHVGIDCFDVHRLARALALPVGDFAKLQRLGRADLEFRILLDGAAPPDARDHHNLSLRKVPASDGGTRCIFLLSVGGRGRCGVYGVRPGVCRVYPTSESDGLIAADGGGRYCPPGAWQLERMDLSYFRGRWREYRAHRAIHHALVDGWNERLLAERGRRDEAAFFSFTLEAYAALERRAPDLFDGSLARAGGLLAPPTARLDALVDEVLRGIGWRTDDTTPFADPTIGRDADGAAVLRVASDVDPAGVLVLDPEEELDPLGAEQAQRLGLRPF